MDVRRAVKHRLRHDVTIGMQRRCEPLAGVDVVHGQRLERSALQRLEALATGDAEATVTPGIDALNAAAERLVDLVQGRKPRASMTEAHIPHQDLDQSFDDRFVAGMIGARGNYSS